MNCPHCRQQLAVVLYKGQAQPTSELESVASTPFEPTMPAIISEKKSFWASDGITYALAGAFAGSVMILFSWYYELNGGVWVAVISFLVGVGLHVLKIIMHAPPRIPLPKSLSTLIKVEHWSDDNKHVLLDELDNRITLDDLRRVAKVVITDGVGWSRANLTGAAGLSQNKFHIITGEFERLNYIIQTANNRHILTTRAKAFLRKVLLAYSG